MKLSALNEDVTLKIIVYLDLSTILLLSRVSALLTASLVF